MGMGQLIDWDELLGVKPGGKMADRQDEPTIVAANAIVAQFQASSITRTSAMQQLVGLGYMLEEAEVLLGQSSPDISSPAAPN